MTDKQQKWFNTRLWPDYCRARGWKTGDRELKLRVVSQIIGREITTTADVGWGKEFDALKTELQLLKDQTNFAGAMQIVSGTAVATEQRKRWIHKLTEFDAPLVAKLTHNFSKGQITNPAELPDNLLKAVVVTCEQRRRAKTASAPVTFTPLLAGPDHAPSVASSGLGTQDNPVEDPFNTGETPF